MVVYIYFCGLLYTVFDIIKKEYAIISKFLPKCACDIGMLKT